MERDILQVRILARHPPGRGACLQELGMQTVVRIKQRREILDIRGEEVLQFPILEDVDDRVLVAYLFKLALASGALTPGRALLTIRGELHLVEQDFTELLGRTDIELASSGLIDGLLYLGQVGPIFFGESRKRCRIDKDATLLHRPHNRDERLLNMLIHFAYAIQALEPTFKCRV